MPIKITGFNGLAQRIKGKAETQIESTLNQLAKAEGKSLIPTNTIARAVYNLTQELVPVDTGKLRASGKFFTTVEKIVRGVRMVHTIAYTAPYAYFVEKNTNRWKVRSDGKSRIYNLLDARERHRQNGTRGTWININRPRKPDNSGYVRRAKLQMIEKGFTLDIVNAIKEELGGQR